MSGRDFCEVCGFDHADTVCHDCGRYKFHLCLQRGPVVLSLISACSYCDFLDEWPSVQADDEAFGAVEMSLALPPRWWLTDLN